MYFLLNATLAATIIVAVISLIDLGALKETFVYSRTEFVAMSATIVLTLLEGVEVGLLAGVGLSIFLHLYKTSKPHIAVVGQIPGTTHFRNKDRHEVVLDPKILSLRVDASLYFPNARYIEDYINKAMLEAVNERLKDGGIEFHLSEVKGPVMDRLEKTDLLEKLSGRVYRTHFEAVASINPELATQTEQAG